MYIFIPELLYKNDYDITKSKDEFECAGSRLLLLTLNEIKRKITGEYDDEENYFFYIDFLNGNNILLNNKYLPDFSTNIDLPGLNFRELLEKQMNETSNLYDELNSYYEDNYGSSWLAIHYLEDINDEIVQQRQTIDQAEENAARDANSQHEDFIEDLELKQSYGAFDAAEEGEKDRILKISDDWHDWANNTKNFGFYGNLLEILRKQIDSKSKKRAEYLLNELNAYVSGNPNLINEHEKYIDCIKEVIYDGNYTVAEDKLNRLTSGDIEEDLGSIEDETDYLSDFVKNYDYFFQEVSNSGQALSKLIRPNRKLSSKEAKAANSLVQNWLTNSRVGENRITEILNALGFDVKTVRELDNSNNRMGSYQVLLEDNYSKDSGFKHLIPAFGSKATHESFRVVCLNGKYSADDLLEKHRELGDSKNTLVLLDYAINLADKRRFARKLKEEAPRKIFAVVDRVVIKYISFNYAESIVNRMLMKIIMPFSYYQPYVYDSANIMPPELFIGRKSELNSIENPNGANIVFGGRQLGKSALLKKAKSDIDQNENGDRAIVVDVKGLDYNKAAKKVADALLDEGILTNKIENTDWSTIARSLKNRLRQRENRIPYFLLMMDEADVFLESCEKVNYSPLDALKEVQSLEMDRFKFVVAGLRNVIRFKNNVATGNNSVLAHLESLTVKPFGIREAKELLEAPLFYLGFRFSKEQDTLISTILAKTNYFPGLIQLYCAKLIEAMTKKNSAGYAESDTPPYDINEKHIKSVLAEEGFSEEIKEKFMITLRLGDDDYYYIIALIIAYLYHNRDQQEGYTPEDILTVAEDYNVKNLNKMKAIEINALLLEMKDLNVLRTVSDCHYTFSRYNFYRMMGTEQEVEDAILEYMEE